MSQRASEQMGEVARPTPEEYQPELRWWGHAWRLALAGAVSAAVWATVFDEQSPLMRWTDAGFAAVAFALALLRRRAPVTVAVLTVLASTVSALAAGAAVLATVSLATRRSWPLTTAIGLLNVAAGLTFSRLQPAQNEEPWWVGLSTNAAVTLAILAWGMYLGSRRELLWTLRARAERAEAEQELRASQSRLAERSRIAREMHDVLAHRISQISMHAGALQYRADLTAEELRENAGVIRVAAHQALDDLRGVLGVLRNGDESDTGGATHAPQPTYADLAELVEDARGSGMSVAFDDALSDPDGEPTAVPDAAGRTLYRIVQESITNARKHAPGAHLTIRLEGTPDDGLSVVVRNRRGFGPSTTPGAGLGLTGLVERAELRGGHLEHGVEDDEFVVRGWIPWAA